MLASKLTYGSLRQCYKVQRTGALKRAEYVTCGSTSTAAAVEAKARIKNTVFRFRHFNLHHGKCAQKMGTDSMLLGSWAEPPPAARSVLDIGTGTGVLALMMAQKTQGTCANIHAIDIDEASYIQAKENAAASPWPERLHVSHTSFQDWTAAAATQYDLIITNPPYFLQSSKPNLSGRAAARHADVLLPFSQLAAGAAQLLHPSGRLCLILPAVEGQRFVSEAAKHGLLLTRMMKVFTKCQDLEPKRHMMQFELAASVSQQQFHANDSRSKCIIYTSSSVERLVVMQKMTDPTTGRSDHVYSDQYRQLTKDFHHPSMFKISK